MKLLILKFSFILILLAKDKAISETLIDLIIYTFKKIVFILNLRSSMNCTELWIQSWNIFGAFKNINGFVYNKLEDPDFIAQIKNIKILGLLETQHVVEDIDKLQIEGFKSFQVCRKKKKFGRKHG